MFAEVNLEQAEGLFRPKIEVCPASKNKVALFPAAWLESICWKGRLCHSEFAAVIVCGELMPRIAAVATKIRCWAAPVVFRL